MLNKNFFRKNKKDLNKILLDLCRKHFLLRIKKAQGILKDTSLIKKTKLDIARIKTFYAKQKKIYKKKYKKN